jgi:hypothetical protein
MNDLWNLPWQALQKALAGDIGAHGIVEGAGSSSAIAQRSAIANRNAAVRRPAAACADSWLSRARCRGAPPSSL